MVFDMISYLRTSLKYLKFSLGFGTICSAFRTIFSMFLSLSILPSIWDAFVDRLGAKVCPNGPPNRSKTNPKTHPKKHWKNNADLHPGGACKPGFHGGTESARILDVGHVDALFRLDGHTLVMCWLARWRCVFFDCVVLSRCCLRFLVAAYLQPAVPEMSSKLCFWLCPCAYLAVPARISVSVRICAYPYLAVPACWPYLPISVHIWPYLIVSERIST